MHFYLQASFGRSITIYNKILAAKFSFSRLERSLPMKCKKKKKKKKEEEEEEEAEKKVARDVLITCHTSKQCFDDVTDTAALTVVSSRL